MSVFHEITEISVFGGGNRDCQTALLRVNGLQTSFAAFICRHMLVAKMVDQPETSRQSGPDVSETKLCFVDHLVGLL